MAAAATLVLLTGGTAGVASPNAIVLENQQPGTTSWQFTNYNKAQAHEIEGYASLTSVNKGAQIKFMVSLSSSAQYTMDVYRMGWYPTGTNPDGSSCAPSCGGRLMQHIGPLSGGTQAACPRVTTATDPNYGMTECAWTPSYTLTVPTSWTTGNYIVKLKRLDGTQLENYMTFVVRDDASTAPIVYSLDVNTWQAYNFWGGAGNNNLGINLYGRFNDVTLANASGSRAYTVSFDRPYLDQGATDGAGNFMVWDFPMVRWMESQGYDMTYVTDVDLESTPTLLNGHRVFVNTGHDEYYSDNMRSNIQSSIASGVNMAFFSANNIYNRITWQSNAAGDARRRVHCDKGGLPNSTTFEWRYLTPEQPENQLLGVMQNGVASARPYLVYDATSWIYAGTGLVSYTGSGTTGVVTSGAGQNALAGLVGYEFDERAGNASSLSGYTSFEPPGVQQVGHSFVPASDNGVNAWSDATLYTAPSGATVFAAGTIQWSFAVDNGYNDGFCDCGHNVASAVGQKITANILNRLSGGSAGAPAAALSPAGLTFASQNVGTTSSAQSITLQNTGSAAMSISSIAVSGASSSDFAQSNTCTATLAAGASCSINVTFTPTAAGARTATLSVTDSASGSPHTASLSGTGATPAPAVSVSPASLTFGSQLVGSTSAGQAVTLQNTGSAALSISSISLTGTNAGDFARSTTCASSLAAGASCSITVTFAPTATGARAASLTVTDNAAGSPHAVALAGTGTAPAATVTPSSLGFGSQLVGSTSASQSITLQNTGSAALTISSIAVSGANSSDFAQSNTCPASLAAGASCTIGVTFAPTAAGARSASLSVTDNAAGSPQSVGLSGTGTAVVPAVSLSPASLGFGSQRVGVTSAAQSVTLQNTGTGALSISSIGLSGANAADFSQVGTCPISPATLAAGASCSISVTFTPSATGARAAALTITDNASGSPRSVPLSGTGTAPAVSLSPSTLAFGSQSVGATSAPQAVTLQNTGSAPLSISAIAVTGSHAADFAQSNGCPATLAAGASCVIDVRFTPSATGARNASLTVTDDAAGSPHSTSLAGTGVVISATLTPATLDLGVVRVGSTGAPQDVTLQNTGTGPVSISGITFSGANAADFSRTTTCAATLPPGGSCTISVSFAPAAAGSRTATLAVADDAAGSPQTVAVSGTGTAPVATLSPTTIAFGSQAVGGTSAAQTLTLQNTGTDALAISSIAMTGVNAADFPQTTTCSALLAAGDSCTVSIAFAPTAAGERSAALRIVDDATGSPHTASVGGTGLAPAASLSPSSLTFGSQLLGTTSASQSVTLQNTGTSALSIASIGLAGTNAADFAQTNACPASLAAGASCSVAVTFTPSAAGARTASLTIADDAPGAPHAVALGGTGAAAVPSASLTPASLGLGAVPVGSVSTPQNASLQNTGTGPLSISSIAFTGANAADFQQTNTCPAVLTAGSSCAISVSLAPSAAGVRNATLTVTDDAAGSPHTVAVSGTGTVPAVSLAPSSLGFGSVRVATTSAAQSVTLQNTGQAPLTISAITIGGTNATDFARTTTCPASLAAGASCSISVTFTPSATGARSATLAVTDNASGSPQSVPLTGTGVAPALTVAPATLTFAARVVGTTSAAQTVTLQNTGTAPTLISSISLTGGNAGDFGQVNACPIAPATLAVGASCTVSVTFTPTALGTRTASVTVVDDAPGSPHAAGLTGTGAPANIAFGASLGTKTEGANGATMKTNTSAAAASGSRIFAFLSWTNATRTLSSISGGNLTWTVDYQAADANGNHLAIASAYAPTGLAANTAVTASYSGSVTHGVMSLASFTGIASATPVDRSASSTQTAATAWSGSVTTTNANDLVLGLSLLDVNATSTAAAPNSELFDAGDSKLKQWATGVYRIETTVGAKTANGTWTTATGAKQLTIAVAYKAG